MSKPKDRRRVTIKDIARHTGYSIATVSRVINKKGVFYSNKTYKKIQEAKDRLGYYPNAIARGLKTKKTSNIAFLEPWIGEFFSEVFLGTQDAANQSDYSTAIFSSNYNSEQEKKNIEVILSNRFDGIIICSAILDNDNLKTIIDHHLPTVIIEKFSSDGRIPYVCIKSREITKEAINHLIGLGHKRIGFISQPVKIGKQESRFKGYKDSLKENNIEFQEFRIFIMKKLEKETFETSYTFIKKNFTKIMKCSAVFTTSDIMAISAIKVIKDMGLEVPDDLSVIGFDGLSISNYIHPSLTTIVQPRYDMGFKAMRMLNSLIDGKSVESLELKATILHGDSTGKVKKSKSQVSQSL
ncbi:LacI family DNA-binding transcriptional regulator [Actinomycetota bacterium]